VTMERKLFSKVILKSRAKSFSKAVQNNGNDAREAKPGRGSEVDGGRHAYPAHVHAVAREAVGAVHEPALQRARWGRWSHWVVGHSVAEGKPGIARAGARAAWGRSKTLQSHTEALVQTAPAPLHLAVGRVLGR
jgi:hypothetical protein